MGITTEVFEVKTARCSRNASSASRSRAPWDPAIATSYRLSAASYSKMAAASSF